MKKAFVPLILIALCVPSMASAQDTKFGTIRMLESAGDWNVRISDSQRTAMVETEQGRTTVEFYLAHDARDAQVTVKEFGPEHASVDLVVNDASLALPKEAAMCPPLTGCYTRTITGATVVQFVHNLTAGHAAKIVWGGEDISLSLAGTSKVIDALDKYNAEQRLHFPPPFHDSKNLDSKPAFSSSSANAANGNCSHIEDDMKYNGNPYSLKGKCYKAIIGLMSHVQWIDEYTALLIPTCSNCGNPTLIHSDTPLLIGRWAVIMGEEPYQYTSASGALETAVSFHVIRYLGSKQP